MNNLLKVVFVLVLTCLATTLWGQVSTEPLFPRADAPLKIIYDASQGTSGLQGAQDVYVHIGAITAGANSTAWSIVPFEWGTADPAAKMTRVAGKADVWEYELTPNEFFEKEDGETIFRLGLVFRNADGGLEGKSEQNSDFFIDLAQTFDLKFVQPDTESSLLEEEEGLEIKVLTTQNSDIRLKVDGKEVAFETDVTSLHYLFTSSVSGSYQIQADATSNGALVSKNIEVHVVGGSPVLPVPNDLKKGINYLSDTEVGLVLEAPGKKNVFVIGDFNNWQVLPDFQMNQSLDGELFWLKLSGLQVQKEYAFQYLVDGEIRIADPYADKIADPFDDQEIIDQDRYPGLLAYPEGQSFQASYLQTNQLPFEWKYIEYTKPKPEELVIYELLVRDFDDRRTYNAVTERLDYLKSLGVNALELMPITEFEGNLSWGYNPSFLFAADKYYGTKEDLKRLIDEAHKRDIVVIMDMVLNHAFGQSPFVRMYNDGDFGSPTADNPWLNTTATHPFNVGYDFNHESEYTQALVDSVNHYWLSEYHVDGYRFDLSKGFTQRISGSDVNYWSQKDESRIEIWKRIYDRIKSHHPDACVILEHLAENDEEKILADYGMMFWGNMNYTFREMAKGMSQDFSYGYFENRGWEKNHLLSYIESHDEERLMWESLNFGDRSLVDLRKLSHAVNRNQLMTAFYFGIPGPKMIWQFGEMGYDEELNNDRLGIKATHWEYLEDGDRNRLLNLYKAMIGLKQENKVFSFPESASFDLSDEIKTISLQGEDLDVVIVGNFGLSLRPQIEVEFPSDEEWFNYLTGEKMDVKEGILEMDLDINEFKIFTNKSLPLPEGQIYEVDLITSLPEEGKKEGGLKIYPVPTAGDLKVEFPDNMGDCRYRILDMTGKVWFEGANYQNDKILAFQVKDIRAGLYIFELYDNRQMLRKQFIKK
ncbi:T9SS type A sorting domain-containing protein [Echinicola sp. CAU 1574]|uniref:T9SS type A sorting domain-containing protein n=1 Tax=Echinicola arenosa TaxID=2774144 RepID=A0ABR9AEW3_9BACT|nr:alpha-amylase family glycosyl hydrolase [Echinicola arenosa]MBD8487186.1 T9SS type A sorting domain-containing protein [Echinicola arenosa]